MKRQAHIYILLCILMSLSACRKSLYDVPYPSEITKTHRESIGDYIHEQIEIQSDFNLLDKTDSNVSAFVLIQRIYDQVTNTMRLDNKSPDANRWERDRPWQIQIIDASDQIAFVIPGGDLYISKGLLKAIASESELYYILATEAILMNDRYLLGNMITAYSTKTLVKIANGDQITDDRVDNIGTDVGMFEYDFGKSEEIKSKVAHLICTTSIYNPASVNKLIEKLSKTNQWMMTRPVGLSNNQIIECGTLETNGLYQSQVLDVL